MYGLGCLGKTRCVVSQSITIVWVQKQKAIILHCGSIIAIRSIQRYFGHKERKKYRIKDMCSERISFNTEEVLLLKGVFGDILDTKAGSILITSKTHTMRGFQCKLRKFHS